MAGEKELQQTLVYGALMYGLKPDKIEIDIATRFTKKNYPTLTLENVLEAFELNTTGKNWTLIEPYGSFSNLFIGKVLTAYEVWLRSKTLREIKALPEPVKNDLISHEEAKPMLKALAKELKKIDLKFRINNKRQK